MKNNVVKFLSALVLAFVVSAPVFAADEAVVTFVKGKVEVAKGSEWVALKVGDKLTKSDTVNTGFQSEAKIKYNGSLMSLGALTRITLDQLSSSTGKEKVEVYLATGAVRSKVTHSEDTYVNYTVKSPVAVASVRGTDFSLTGDGKCSCFEGAVAVYPNRKPRKQELAEMAEVEEEEAEESAESTAAGAADNAGAGAGEAGESEEAAETADAPSGDNGPANSTTPANEISNDAPTGAVVVGANQKTSFTKGGNPEKPIDNAKKNVNKVKSYVQTAADKETVTAGGTTSNSETSGKDVPDTTPKTGTIEVSIDFE